MRDTGRAFRQDAAITVTAAAGESPAWRTLTREFDLPPGVGQIRLVVRDPANGAIGSVVHRLEVPFPGELRVSTPVLTDLAVPGQGPGDRPQPAVAAHRVFPAAGGLYCQFEVFGAVRPGNAPPRVAAGFQVRSRDGSVVREAAPTPIAPGPDGRLVRLVGVSVEGLPEGPYELRHRGARRGVGREGRAPRGVRPGRPGSVTSRLVPGIDQRRGPGAGAAPPSIEARSAAASRRGAV